MGRAAFTVDKGEIKWLFQMKNNPLFLGHLQMVSK